MHVQTDGTCFPLIHSVARELEAIAEPQPNVLNLASIIFPFSSTLIWKSGMEYKLLYTVYIIVLWFMQTSPKRSDHILFEDNLKVFSKRKVE